MTKIIKYNRFKFFFLGATVALQLAAIALPQIVLADIASDSSASCARLDTQFNNLDPGGNTLSTKPSDVTGQFPHRYCTVIAVANGAIVILFSLSGAAAVLFLIIGGFQFLTSAGNQEQAEKGKKTLMYAVIGLIIIILASTIVRIIVNLLFQK